MDEGEPADGDHVASPAGGGSPVRRVIDPDAMGPCHVLPNAATGDATIPVGALFGLVSLPNVDAIVATVLSLALFAFIVGIAIAIWREIRKDTVFLEPIEVPADLARRGYSPTVTAAQLLDEARAIQTRTTSLAGRRPLANVAALADLQLPGGRLSVRSLVRLARSILGRPATSIGGEIYRNADGYRIRLRIRGMAIAPIAGPRAAAARIEEVLHAGALDLLQAVDPQTLALHLSIAEHADGDAHARLLLRQVIRNGTAADRARALGLLANIENRHGVSATSLRLYADSLAAHRRIASPVVLGNYVTHLMQSGHDREALAAVEDVEARRPRDPGNFAAAAYAYNVLGLFERALAAANAAIAIRRRHPLAHQHRGLALVRLRRFAEAIAALERANALDPDSPLTEVALVMALAWSGRTDDALACARESLARTPDHYYPHMGMGYAELARGNGAAALDHFERADRIFSSSEWCKVGYGRALLAAGRHEDALARYEEGIRENPRFGYAWSGAGEALLALGRPEEALAKFERAAALDAHDPGPLHGAAGALDALGRHDEAAAMRLQAEGISLSAT